MISYYIILYYSILYCTMYYECYECVYVCVYIYIYICLLLSLLLLLLYYVYSGPGHPPHVARPAALLPPEDTAADGGGRSYTQQA